MKIYFLSLLSIFLGLILDVIFGDPSFILHPIVLIGKTISFFEKILRKIFLKTAVGEFIAGMILSITVPMLSLFLSFFALYLAYKISPVFFFILNTFWAFQIPASKSLADSGKFVLNELEKDDIENARIQLSYIVGRETNNLTKNEIIKATVETIVENTSDGIIAPEFFMLIGGVPLGFFYKSINTLDSMVGYRNEKYEYFGKCSAKIDDVLNFIPSRITAIFMIISSIFLKLDYKNAEKIFIRDRYNHLSPNSAQTESVISGALGIMLGGTHKYFGKIVVKKTIGDNLRNPKNNDIKRTIKIMYFVTLIQLLIYFIFLMIILLKVIKIA